MWACHVGSEEVVEALLSVPNIDVQHQSSKAYTPNEIKYPAGVTALNIAERLGHWAHQGK